MVDYAAVLTHHPDYAGRRCSIINNDYATLVIHDDGPKPTKKSLEDRYPAVAYQLEYAAVQAARRARYQAETDGLFFAAQREGGDLTAWQAAVEQIKAELPYPEAPE
jgi:hypothetical protein